MLYTCKINSFFLLFVLFSCSSFAENIDQKPESISSSSIVNFNKYPEKVKSMINLGLSLTQKNIGYKYGSADPNTGGMDCSGTIYYILSTLGLKAIPRSSNLIYSWAKENGHLHTVTSTDLNSAEFSHLLPGDLLFWKGTYQIVHDPDVTHVMMYIGKNKKGDPLMLGASDGRTYKGRQIYGVSIFDFQLPKPSSKSKFLGYSCVPEISCAARPNH
jgi:hypothetical protein